MAENFEIYLLVGADFYWDLVGDHFIRGDGPTAMSSKLGYLLSETVLLPHTPSVAVNICDWACKNQPCECKLHRVIFSLISSALIEVFCFREVQREAHEILQW